MTPGQLSRYAAFESPDPGTFEGFARIGSERKWLDAHGGKKWGYYYSADGLRQQQAFFDHFLLDRQTGIGGWPRVRYQVRDRGGEGRWKAAADWPVPGTSYQPLYLDAGPKTAGTLTRVRPGAAATVSYDSERAGRARGRATFDLRFEAATEVVGGTWTLAKHAARACPWWYQWWNPFAACQVFPHH